MRIELNAGGLSGLTAIATFENDIHALDGRIEDMIDSFQTVQEAVFDLPGGADTLNGAVDDLQQRIREEQRKKQNLENFKTRFGDFLDLAVSVDRAVADLVRQNQEMFFRQNEHLRPRITIEDLRWIPGIPLLESLMKVGEFLEEHWDAVVMVTVSVVIVVAGVALIVLSGGTALGVIIGVGAILGGIGAGVGGLKNYSETGKVDVMGALGGYTFGFAGGVAIGAGIYYGGVVLVGKANVALKFLGLGIEGFASNAGMDFFDQTVVKGDSVGLQDYNIKQTIGEGAIGAVFNIAFGGILKIGGGEKALQKVSWYISNKITQKLAEKGIVNISSAMIGNSIEYVAVKIVPSVLKNTTDQYVEIARGEREKFDRWDLIKDVGMDMVFDKIGDYTQKQLYPQNYDPALPAVQNTEARYPMVQQDVTDAFEFDRSLRAGSDSISAVQMPVEIEYYSTPTDMFDGEIVDIKRTDVIRQGIGNTGDNIVSRDLRKPSYQTESGLKSVLQSDVRRTTGDTLRVVIPDTDLTIPQINALRDAAEYAHSEGIQLIVMPQLVAAQ